MALVFVRYERIFAGILIALFALHALIYSTGPIFEPPDERLHYTYIRYLVADHTLPIPTLIPARNTTSRRFITRWRQPSLR